MPAATAHRVNPANACPAPAAEDWHEQFHVGASHQAAAGAVARTSRPPARIHGPKTWAPYLLVLPSVLVLIGVMIYPIVYGVYLSLFEYRMTQSLNWTFVGLGNYRRLFFQTPDFLNSIWVTFQFTVLTITAEFVIGLSLALLLNMDFPCRTLFRTLVLLPLMVPAARLGPVVAGDVRQPVRRDQLLHPLAGLRAAGVSRRSIPGAAIGGR